MKSIGVVGAGTMGVALALLQNEIPEEANLRAMKLCTDRGIKVSQNPSPILVD